MASTSSNVSTDSFLEWFNSKGGSVHPAVGLTTFPKMGRGAVALQDIKKGTTLFKLPRSMTLSIRTSSLRSQFGELAWKKHGLHKGWIGLILCMLWEAAAGNASKWSIYLSSLPDSFQTPIFWLDADLQELVGTTIYDKIGKAEAEVDYYEKLLPAVKSRPDLFPTASVDSHYSLRKYHIMGNLILSRSFHVEKWNQEIDEESDHENSSIDAARSSDAMQVDHMEDDETPGGRRDAEDEANDSDSEDEDESYEDPADVAMVPMADMLNARYHTENAKLCYEADELEMISTQDISAGEQIWNTYGDLPNSDLLRRYGHVDIVPMPGGGEGNPADIVEIRADLVVEVIRGQTTENADDIFSERIEWWLEEGGDDVFTLETTLEIPDGLISLIRLLTASMLDWESIREKSKIPKPRPDPQILHLVDSILEKRFGAYKTSIEEDEVRLANTHDIHTNMYMAAVVRLGEKRILKGVSDAVKKTLVGHLEKGDRGTKRKVGGTEGSSSERSKKARS